VARELVGGSRLVGRRYFVRDRVRGERQVEVVTGWGPGATMRNVRVRFLDTGEETVRPFRGLTRERRTGR
jgi:hypothetical protein